MATQTTLAALQGAQLPANREANMPAVQAGFFDLQGFELMQRIAKAFASSTLVPEAYRGNVANTMIALNLARRMNADALMVMQNLYVVHGSPAWSSKFLIATVNTCGRFSALRYEWRGDPGADGYGCRAWAVERETGERLNGIWVDWNMVRAEKWDAKNGSKWKTMPDQMFVYRAAAFWVRAYAPEISMGLSTAEEMGDVIDVDPDGSYTITTEALRPAATVDAGPTNDEPKPKKPTPKPKADDGPTMTYAQVRAQIESAADLDALDVAASSITAVADDEQQGELSAIYKARRATMQEDSK